MQPDTKPTSKVISVRLPYEMYLQLWDFCQRGDHNGDKYNFNSGMKKLIETHPRIHTYGTEQSTSVQS